MYPNPGQNDGPQALQRARQMNDASYDAYRRRRRSGRSGSGLAGLLKLLLLVGVVVFLVQNPELRAEIGTFAQNVWADVQTLWADAENG